MDQLPQELVDQISYYLAPDDLKNTLLLSHAFCFSAEKYSGAFASFHLDKHNAGKFINTFSGHRLLYLRDLRFEIRLPFPKDRNCRDDADQLRQHNVSLTQQISFLFKTIKTVEECAGTLNVPGRIRLSITSPSRPIPGGLALTWHDCLSWRVRLLKPEVLPLIESIRSLEVDGYGGSSSTRVRDPAGNDWVGVKLDYRVMVDLVAKLPNLEYWGCRMGGNEWSPKTKQEATRYFTQDWAGPRRDSRWDFAKALLSIRLPDSLRRIRLDFLHDLYHSTHIDHLTAQPDLVSPTASDPFSTSLHHLTHHLRRLHLRVVADETLFWPKDNCTTPWPNLESLVVMFHMVSPSGQWYFVGPNGEGRETAAFKITDASYPPLKTTPYDKEMDWQITSEGDRRYRGSPNTNIRIVPNDSTLRPFLAAFAKAASTMRALQEAVLWCPLAWAPYDEDGEELDTDWLPKNCPDRDKLAWGLHYQAKNEPNFTRHGGGLPTKVPLLWWKVGKWRPDPELHELFKKIGRTPWGDVTEEHWEDEDFGEGLIDREYFEYCAQEEVDRVGLISLPR
jgi:hypothetical protein